MTGLLMCAGPADAGALDALASDVAAHWRAGTSIHLIVPRGAGAAAPPGWQLHADSDFLPPGVGASSGLWKQMLMLAAHRLFGDEPYLCLDAGTALGRVLTPAQLFVSGRPIFELQAGSRSDRRAEIASLSLLGRQKKDVIGLRPDNQILIPKNIRTLLDCLASEDDALMRLSQTAGWTAAQLYGGFCWYHQKGGGHVFCTGSWVPARRDARPARAAKPPRDTPAAGDLRQRQEAWRDEHPWPVGQPPPMAQLLPMLERHDAGHAGPLAAIADLIFVVNLKTSLHRLAFQREQATRLGYGFYRFPGILGRNVTPHEIPTTLVSSQTVQRLLGRNPGGLGQGVAYLELLSAIAALEDADRRVLVLEDDAEFLPGAAQIIPAGLAALPPGWDLVTLGICSWNQGGLITSWDYDGEPRPPSLTPHLREQRGGYQLSAWLYSVRGARKLLAGLLPWHDELDYRRFRDFLRHRKYRGMSPTPGSLDLFLQVQLADLAAFHLHHQGANLVRECEDFPSTIAPQGRRH